METKEANPMILQQELRDLLFVRPFDIIAIESAACRLCDYVFDVNKDIEI